MAILALPALIALLFKAVLFAYALRTERRDATTRLFMFLLVLFSLQNIVEFVGFNHLAGNGVVLDATMEKVGYLFFLFGILFFAVVLHLSLRLSVDNWDNYRHVVPLLYLPVPILEYLLLATDKLVAGFTVFGDYTILRIPGPWYFLFETYAPIYLLAALSYLIYGARSSRMSNINRLRNRYWLAALLPFVLLHTYLVVANHFGMAKISVTISNPIAVTLFLLIATYATHQYRLFDIEFFLPWSKLRKRKTVFYRRIQTVIAEIADLRSAKDVLEAIAGALRCQVALLGGERPLLAAVARNSGADKSELLLSRFPVEVLKKVDHIVVANEIADTLPDLHRLMRHHKVGAVVPFRSRSATAGHWMLLGDHFSNEIYTPLDFKVVEKLFDRIAERFLNDLVLLRSQLSEAHADLRDYKHRLALAWDDISTLRNKLTASEEEARKLRKDNAVLRRERLRVVSTRLPEAIVSGEKTLERYLTECEAELIAAALKHCDGDKAKAARLLGIWPNTLRYIMERHGMSAPSSK